MIKQSESDDIELTFENEIPGGFDFIEDMSTNIENEDSSCYVDQEDLILKPYIGLDWNDIEVNSDSEF